MNEVYENKQVCTPPLHISGVIISIELISSCGNITKKYQLCALFYFSWKKKLLDAFMPIQKIRKLVWKKFN